MHRHGLFLCALLAFSCATVRPPEPGSAAIYGSLGKLSCKDRSLQDVASFAEPGEDFDLGLKWRRWFIRQNLPGTVTVTVYRYDSDRGIHHTESSGVIISETGRVLTAQHVIRKARFITVAPRYLGKDGKSVLNGRDYEVMVVASSEAADVALLVPIHPQHFPADMPKIGRMSRPSACERVWQFGNTTGWSHGLVADPALRSGGLKIIRAGIAIDHGDSGGPLVDDAGNLIGITSSLWGKKGEYGNFIPIADALSALGLDELAGK